MPAPRVSRNGQLIDRGPMCGDPQVERASTKKSEPLKEAKQVSTVHKTQELCARPEVQEQGLEEEGALSLHSHWVGSLDLNFLGHQGVFH